MFVFPSLMFYPFTIPPPPILQNGEAWALETIGGMSAIGYYVLKTE